jgi:hypothetical protein
LFLLNLDALGWCETGTAARGRVFPLQRRATMTLPKIPLPPEEPPTEGIGDVRGAYGYGRPAHGSDPQARYGFAPKPAVSTMTEFADDCIAAEESAEE